METSGVCYNLRKMSRAITQFYDQGVKSTGLEIMQFSLLVEISTTANKHTITK
jgi:hypothetical protein